MPSTKQITSVLVANRGEIACRVFATARRYGISTVAVFSDADEASPHVREADHAVRLPGVAPADTYLRGDLIIQAALRAGADAIHPGYGFLSENAEFARQVEHAGLLWIGPSPRAIEIMGSKVESKERMRTAGVPVLDRLVPETVTEAELPVLVKASAGGGGRGMRVVERLEDLPEILESAAREAQSAFGDPTVFCERYLPAGHHVEVQVMADEHGTVWALGERECSLQRRHQKVIEEAPSPLVERVGPQMRADLLAAARDAAAAVDYRGAGTVEFLAADDGRFWFLEMNTRLQVEHPVTECVTGLDLVALQFDVAQGLPLLGPEPTMTGHAIEARLYAEDPADGWAPQSGTLHTFEIAEVDARFSRLREAGIRLDSGVEAGCVVGVHYDPMLAKVIAFAPTRVEAARRLAGALRRSRVNGFTTNRAVVVESLADPDFLAGRTDTSFYDTHAPAQLLAQSRCDEGVAAIVAAMEAQAAARHAAGGLVAQVPPGFRVLRPSVQHRVYTRGDAVFDVGYRMGRAGLELEALPAGVESVDLVEAAPGRVVLSVDGVRSTFVTSSYRVGSKDMVTVDGPGGSVTFCVHPRFSDPSVQTRAGALVAPMPGTVTRLAVAVGDAVRAGSPLLWMEAMKMEHVVVAESDGIVDELSAQVGHQVQEGQVLCVVRATGGDGDQVYDEDATQDGGRP